MAYPACDDFLAHVRDGRQRSFLSDHDYLGACVRGSLIAAVTIALEELESDGDTARAIRALRRAAAIDRLTVADVFPQEAQ